MLNVNESFIVKKRLTFIPVIFKIPSCMFVDWANLKNLLNINKRRYKMVGITSYGAYIPWHRMERKLFVKAWGGFAVPGERSVAYYDEDSVTMAVTAAMECIRGFDPQSVDGIFFSTTGLSDRIAPTSIGKAAFLAPLISTVPLSLWRPLTSNFSIIYFPIW